MRFNKFYTRGCVFVGLGKPREKANREVAECRGRPRGFTRTAELVIFVIYKLFLELEVFSNFFRWEKDEWR